MELKILLVGGSGLLGSDLYKAFRGKGWDVIAPSHEELDITDTRSVESFSLFEQPNWIVNAAGFTAVNEAEFEGYRAIMVNAFGALMLARYARDFNARFLHMSTDYVFDGKSNRPYRETDACNPINFYGLSKWHGERMVQEENPEALIIRTAWLFGKNGDCFPKRILEAAKKETSLKVVNDQIGSPTYTVDLAEAITKIIELSTGGGIYHVVNDGQASWYDLAKATLDSAGISISLEPISSKERHDTARRPAYSVLDTSKYQSLGFEPLPHWRNAVERFVRNLHNG